MMWGLLVRLAFAACLALLLAAPAFAGSRATINVGVVVTGAFASPLVGSWHSKTAALGSIYHFTVSGRSGAFYQLVSLPLPEGKGSCDLRVGGVIHSLERAAKRSSYEMRYSIQSADVVTSSTDVDGCTDVAAAYLSDVSADGTRRMILSRTGRDRLIDTASGTEYALAP